MTADEINQLIQQYGRPVFDLAMRQVYIDALTSVIWAVVGIVSGVGLLLLARYLWAKHNAAVAKKGSYGIDTDGCDMLAAFAGIGAVLPLVMALICVLSLTALLNPEFAALKSLMSVAK